MKKVYKNPEIEVVKMQTMQMMAASLPLGEPLDDASGAEARELIEFEW